MRIKVRFPHGIRMWPAQPSERAAALEPVKELGWAFFANGRGEWRALRA
jgi:hypothetical protein